ncbi:MAG: EamA/RhaT family transporter, partial [Lachnospiraceae bacterium]|nr:EamA/RhaT family transporter [Lachnospiraceae bacterium]
MKKSYIYAGITILLWSTMSPIVKTLIGGIPNFEALAAGSCFAFLFLFARNALKGNLRIMKTIPAAHYAVMAGMGFVGIFTYSSLYYYGLDNL